MSRRGKDQPALFGPSESDLCRGFGPSAFRTAHDPPTGFGIRERSAERLREAVRADAPRSPGVYGMLGPKGHIVYVGKAKNLRARLLSYFRDSSDPKAGKIVRHTHTLVWEHAADEFAALLRELELIRRFRPRFNVLGIPGRQRYVYLCLGRGPAAYAYLTRETTGKELAVYGPFVGRGRTHEAVRRLNMEFKLRDCPGTVPMAFADQAVLFDTDRSAKCLRYELGTCLGPCGGFCTGGQYAANVRAAKAFLDGRDRSAAAAVERQMLLAAGEFRFEQAAALRDRLTALTWLYDKLTFLRTARSHHSFVYPLTGWDNLTRWYLIHGGEVRAVVREPGCGTTAAQAAAALDAVFADKFTVQTALERCVDSVLIVTGWFHKRAAEKASLLTKKDAAARCGACRPEPGPP